MYFELNDISYAVKFYRQSTTTFAELWCRDDNGELKQLSPFGIARLYYTDRFQKSTGRKVALARLLNSMEKELSDFGKAERTLIWKTYFEKHRR